MGHIEGDIKAPQGDHWCRARTVKGTPCSGGRSGGFPETVTGKIEAASGHAFQEARGMSGGRRPQSSANRGRGAYNRRPFAGRKGKTKARAPSPSEKKAKGNAIRFSTRKCPWARSSRPSQTGIKTQYFAARASRRTAALNPEGSAPKGGVLERTAAVLLSMRRAAAAFRNPVCRRSR